MNQPSSSLAVPPDAVIVAQNGSASVRGADNPPGTQLKHFHVLRVSRRIFGK
jgi:hypothetical protein